MRERSRKKKSDIDILAEIDKEFSLLKFVELKIALENAVKKK
jgi:predicted nucleotidyltransferase